jgi:hypothetical protein
MEDLTPIARLALIVKVRANLPFFVLSTPEGSKQQSCDNFDMKEILELKTMRKMIGSLEGASFSLV